MSTASTLYRTVFQAAVAAFVALGGCLPGLPSAALAQTPGVTPDRATVYIRVIGDFEIDRPPNDARAGRRLQETDVELSSGSGFLISPSGHVLTAAHVVSPESGKIIFNGFPLDVKQTVRRIEVLFPGDEGTGPGSGPLPGSVLASDAGLDLAVLSINGFNLPFLDLGDSDAAAVGDVVEAVGFPFGEQVEIGRPSLPLSSAPAPSVSRGNLSAFRDDVQGERRYMQVTAALNSGNSGGPIVDGDGYVVAIANSVIRSRGNAATGVGFGVPINLAKRFLESYGVDSVLRARRAAAGPPFTLEGKGLRLPMPLGMSDASPARTRVDAGGESADGILLRVDRVVSPWPAARVAEALYSGRAFEAFTSSSPVAPQAVTGGRGRLLVGRATGTMDDGTPARMEFAVAEAGTEKVVARFIGPPHQLAYNASILRAALRQLEMDALRAPARALAGQLTWALVTPPRGTAIDRVQMPAGWIVEAAGPFACSGLPAPSDVAAASPPADFAVALRAGWLPGVAATAPEAAAACGTQAREDASAYNREFTFLGTRYMVEGRFVAVADEGLLQLESVAPAEQANAVRPVLSAWAAEIAASGRHSKKNIPGRPPEL